MCTNRKRGWFGVSEELVWVAPVRTNSAKVYHTKRCRAVGDRHTQRRLERCKRADMEECAYCAGTFEPNQDHDAAKELYKKALEWNPDNPDE